MFYLPFILLVNNATQFWKLCTLIYSTTCVNCSRVESAIMHMAGLAQWHINPNSVLLTIFWKKKIHINPVLLLTYSSLKENNYLLYPLTYIVKICLDLAFRSAILKLLTWKEGKQFKGLSNYHESY